MSLPAVVKEASELRTMRLNGLSEVFIAPGSTHLWSEERCLLVGIRAPTPQSIELGRPIGRQLNDSFALCFTCRVRTTSMIVEIYSSMIPLFGF